ncbi:MAG: DNA-binding protein [Candidatus Bathyarchaeota archaeon]|nr:DNA-binding protein [Candidatus Bathyarchaeota archaeon]
MMKYTQAKMGRIFILRLHDNDHLPDVIEEFALKERVSSALCFLVGGVKDKGRVVVGPKNGEVLPVEPMVRFLSGVHEICGVGTIFLNEEKKPKLHMHASFGRDKETLTGCLRMGMDIWRIGEAIILELTETTAKRVIDKETSFEFLEV